MVAIDCALTQHAAIRNAHLQLNHQMSIFSFRGLLYTEHNQHQHDSTANGNTSTPSISNSNTARYDPILPTPMSASATPACRLIRTASRGAITSGCMGPVASSSALTAKSTRISKASLWYILSTSSSPCEDSERPMIKREPSTTEVLPSLLRPLPSLLAAASRDATSRLQWPSISKKKRKARVCTTEGCDKYVVDHGLCIRHGGGKRCSVAECNCRAQNRGLCWKHGGFTMCKVENCTKRAKSRGICWSHGGGTRCKFDRCTKIAVSLGLCWAHGGGKRCIVHDCRKPASERTDNFCNEHFANSRASAPESQAQLSHEREAY